MCDETKMNTGEWKSSLEHDYQKNKELFEEDYKPTVIHIDIDRNTFSLTSGSVKFVDATPEKNVKIISWDDEEFRNIPIHNSKFDLNINNAGKLKTLSSNS